MLASFFINDSLEMSSSAIGDIREIYHKKQLFVVD